MTKDEHSWEIYLSFSTLKKKIFKLLTFTSKKLLPQPKEVTANQANTLQKSLGLFLGASPNTQIFLWQEKSVVLTLTH